MEELNYFTGEFSESELKNHFDSLDENKLKHELENFTNQYLELSEEEQLKYAGSVLFVCMNLIEKIGKTTAKNILVTLNKILLNNVQLFDWFESRKKYSNENNLSVLNLGVNYYYVEGSEEDHIKGNVNNTEYDILLSNASSGVQSITPLIAMIEYLTKWIYNEDTISFEQNERRQRVNNILFGEIVLKPYFEKDSLPMESFEEFVKSFNQKLSEKEEKAVEYFNNYKTISNSLFKTNNSQFIIEEPEQNLFPETQRDLVYYLLQKCLDKEGNRLTFTTHSPYILYALNNCMMAGLVSDKMDKEELSKLKCNHSKVFPSFVSIYEIRDGVVDKTIQGEDGLISDNYFDQKMKELMDDFYLMLNDYE